jgi:Flp pilus assembly protein CpaB
VQDAFAARLQKTRGGALAIGGIAALLAALLLVVYLRQYRASIDSGSQPMSVLVAKRLIPKGTSGSVVAQKDMFQVATIRKDQLKNLAVSDPAAVSSRVAVADIYPGQQLTAADFSAESASGLSAQLTGAQRAIALPLDGPHGLGGQIEPGDRVDVYVNVAATGGPVVKLLASNIDVLAVDGARAGGVGQSGSASGTVTLRVAAAQAADFAFGSDNAKLWLVLRPQAGAESTPRDLVTGASVLAGSGR